MLDVEASLVMAQNASSALPTELLNEARQQAPHGHFNISTKTSVNKIKRMALLAEATEEWS